MAYSFRYGKPTAQFYLLIVGVFIAIGACIWFFLHNANSATKTIDTDKYQAVFLTNGQVYFGRLVDKTSDYFQLTDVYYLQTNETDTTSDNPQDTTTQSNDVKLIKLGSEVHGPEDQMTILKDQVLFFENIKSDGDVGKLIQNIKNTDEK